MTYFLLNAEVEWILRELSSDPHSVLLRHVRPAVLRCAFGAKGAPGKVPLAELEELLAVVGRTELAAALRRIFRRCVLADDFGALFFGRPVDDWAVLDVPEMDRAYATAGPGPEQLAQHAQRLSPGDESRHTLGLARIWSARPEAAARVFEAELERGSTRELEPLMWTNLGLARSLAGDPTAALVAYTRAAALRGGWFAPALSGLVTALQSQDAAAVREFELRVEALCDPDHPALEHFTRAHARRAERGAWRPSPEEREFALERAGDLGPSARRIAELFGQGPELTPSPGGAGIGILA